MPRTKTTTRTSTNRQLDETSTTGQLDNKHEQKWQGHHNSENQLLWALLFDFLAKYIMPYAAKQLEITFRISLTLFKAISKL